MNKYLFTANDVPKIVWNKSKQNDNLNTYLWYIVCDISMKIYQFGKFQNQNNFTTKNLATLAICLQAAVMRGQPCYAT